MAESNAKTGHSLELLSHTNGQCNPLSEQTAARSILDHALERVLPESALRRYVSIDEATHTLTVAGREYNLNNYKRIFVVGGGKAARRTGAELVNILGDRITAGILNVYHEQAKEPISDRIKLFAADHPTPNEEGVEGARQIVELLKSADEKTLVIALISGGGSSLMALPVEGISLEDYKTISKLLLTVPATIDEINAVRKHLDPLKGGGMCKFAERAGGFISLVLSDVPVTKTGVVDDPSVIASGPTVGDGSTFQMAKKVLTSHNIWDKTPLAVKKYIEANLGKEDNETLPKDSFLLTEDKSQYVIIANNDQAMEAAKERAEQLGYPVYLIGCRTGTTEDKIKAEVTQEIENIWKVMTPYLTDNDNITFASFSTDGVDGNSDLAGAIADKNTLKLARSKGLDYQNYLDNYDSATFFEKLGLDIETGPTGTNVADISLVLITNPNNPYRKIAVIFGGEATVKVVLSEGQKPGFGGRNTHLALLAAEKLAQLNNPNNRLDREVIRKGLIKAGISESQIEISRVGCLGYATDVGPISLTPMAVIGVRSHSDVEKAVRFAYEHNIPINARGAGSGLPAQSVGSGIVLDMRSLDKMQVLEDHPEGGKVVLAQCGVICTRLNNYLKKYGVFLASYPASTDMATIGGMIANNASGANSCKLGTTQHHVLDLHVVLADGTSLWTSEIKSDSQPWKRILELIRLNKDIINKDFPRVPKNSSGYNVLDILRQLEKGIPVDWTRLFSHSEGTLGVITEAKLRAVPLATQKATCMVYFTDLKEACSAIPKVYNLAPSCFDTAITTNLDLIRKTYPNLGIPEEAKVMYLIEFDDVEVKPDPHDPARRIGRVRIMDKQAAADLIQSQVEALRKLLEEEYSKSSIGFEVARDPAKQDALWQGRRSALQVLYAYDPGKRPLTMIECVVIPRDEGKLLEFISYMEEVFSEEQVVAGTHGHAGDCNFHLYLLLNLSQQQDRQRLIHVMTKITQKVIELGGSMSGEHADGRTRGVILPHVFGVGLFDLFVKIKDLMDPRTILHPGVKIIREARDKDLYQAIEELVGIEEKESRLNLARFRDFSHLFSGVCSLCSQCADTCPIFQKLSEQFSVRSEAAPTFKRALAMALDANKDLETLKEDPLFKKIFDLCLLCGQCTFKCPTNASIRDIVMKIREDHRSKVIAPALFYILSHPKLYQFMVKFLGLTQGIWFNRSSRRIISFLPQRLLPTRIPYERYLPALSKSSVRDRYPELANLSAPEADIAYFYGCSSDVFAEPIIDSFINIARHNHWKVALPPQRCCGEPFGAYGHVEKSHRLARYNIDQLSDYKYIVAHCPSCIYGFKEYAKDFARMNDKVYEEKARALVKKLYDPAQFIMEVIGPDKLRPRTRELKQKVTVHQSCHEKLGQKMTATPNHMKNLLNLIPGAEIVDMQGANDCCGLGGPWGLGRHYDFTLKLRQDKISSIINSQADIVTSWCLGCMLQMRDGLIQAESTIQARHPLELLSEAYGQ
jgi:glycerate-2-kinase/FAD/FMN-containing dehydrogenase/Fe-S oxidoreductase